MNLAVCKVLLSQPHDKMQKIAVSPAPGRQGYSNLNSVLLYGDALGEVSRFVRVKRALN